MATKTPTASGISRLLASECWLPVPGWEGYYEVSDFGRFRALDRVVFQLRKGTLSPRRIRGRLLNPPVVAGGYRHCRLSRDAKVSRRLLHHLVLEAHDRPALPGEECRHLDGDPHNNRLDNLKWDSHPANERDKLIHGTHLMGERNHRARLSEPQILAIRSLYSTGEYTQKQLGERFGVDHSTISCVVRGKTWVLTASEGGRPMTVRQPTPQSISRLLKLAGFERSESSATRIKGWRNHSEGYSVTKWDDYGTVEVSYHRGLISQAEADRIRSEMMERYAKAIADAGYSVATGIYGRLIVTAKTED